MEIITAGDGTAHVSSADDGAIYAGIIGQECYVTGIGDKLSCTMQGANTALVGTGVGIMYGRAFRVAMPEEVTIQSGTQSQRRHDVICAHFTTSSDGHESGELVVLKGTPTSGQEADDPEVPSGDILEGATEAYMPLWRIPLDGINVGDPEPLFDVIMSMAELRDSVSQIGANLWEGELVHGSSVEVPGIEGSTVIGVGVSANLSDGTVSILVPCVRYGSVFRGMSGMPSGTDVRAVAINVSASGSRLTNTDVKMVQMLASGSVSVTHDRMICAVYKIA